MIEMDMTLRLNPKGENLVELFDMPKQEAHQLETQLETRILTSNNVKKAFVEMIKEYEGDSRKMAWLVYTLGKLQARRKSVMELIENGAERVIQHNMSKDFQLLLHSGLSIGEVREVLEKHGVEE